MHILQVSPRVPFPLHDGGAIGIYNITKGLLEAGHRVTMLALNTPKHHQPADVLAHLGPHFRLVTVDVDTRLRPLRALANLLLPARQVLGVTTRLPYNVERFVSPAVARRLTELLHAEPFDIVQFEGSFVVWYAGYLSLMERQQAQPNGPALPPLVVRAHNVEYRIWETLAQGERNPLKKWYFQHLARRMKSFERWSLHRVDAVAAITPEDIARLQALGCPVPLALVPAAVELGAFQPDLAARPRSHTAFMIGSLNWLPNLEGLEWLLREVWPAVHAELPELELHVAGSHPPAHLTSRPPGQHNVFIHGFVDSAAAFMRQYELMLVPLLSGGGMRIKIIEGMAAGKAILSTALGAEGVAAHDGRDLLLRDGAAAWQQALRDYYHGRLPVAALGAAAAQTAADTYANARVTQRFEALYAQALAARGA
ncbi:glycosyltransferase [Hymenobacter sp. RP-2-7]|uniref:Glycosyltransferase n=1 Tax=Hymenobacter polaris TaxID=2682546 RepID=A0A7Y0AC82_9BACT|nr:glycosyltransferase family 4 protein [Hymenobacter polaris]NML64673.1 glycosyltransferase [Hymenobacter polaris]